MLAIGHTVVSITPRRLHPLARRPFDDHRGGNPGGNPGTCSLELVRNELTLAAAGWPQLRSNPTGEGPFGVGAADQPM